MPVVDCQADGKPGFKWGDGGKCFTYTGGKDGASAKRARAKAVEQGQAIELSKARAKGRRGLPPKPERGAPFVNLNPCCEGTVKPSHTEDERKKKRKKEEEEKGKKPSFLGVHGGEDRQAERDKKRKKGKMMPRTLFVESR